MNALRDCSALVFDFGGTLDAHGVDWWDRLHVAFSEIRTGLVRDDFVPVARLAAQRLGAHPDVLRLGLADTVRELVRLIADEGRFDAAESRRIADEFIGAAEIHLRENLANLERLSARFRLGCISNNWGNCEGWCRDAGYDRLFEFVIDSTAVGLRKPDPRIFHLALDRLGLTERHSGYVGDNFDADVRGAKGAGWTSVWIVGREGKPCPDESLVDIRVTQVADLVAATT